MHSHHLAEFKDGHSAIPLLDRICTTLSLPVRWVDIKYRRSNFLETPDVFHFEVEVERIEYPAPLCPEPKTLRLFVACSMIRFHSEPRFELTVTQILRANHEGKLVGLSIDEVTIWLLGQSHRVRRGRGQVMSEFRQILGAKLTESLTGPLDTLSIPEVTS